MVEKNTEISLPWPPSRTWSSFSYSGNQSQYHRDADREVVLVLTMARVSGDSP